MAKRSVAERAAKDRDKASSGRRTPIRVGAAAALLIGVGAAVVLLPRDHTPARVSFSVVAPAEGAVVGSPVRLDVALRGATIGTPTSGRDHLHIWVDGAGPVADYTGSDTTLPLPPGPHTLIVQLAGPDHAPLLPDASVRFAVRP